VLVLIASAPLIVAVTTGKFLKKHLQPFDCYDGDGGDYSGLHELTESGRACQNWIANGKYAPTTKGIGNHKYCRNPFKKHGRPWCFVFGAVDKMEWEYCTVPECPADGGRKEAWVAPKGSKSTGDEPCTPAPDTKPKFEMFEKERSCMDSRGSTKWLVGDGKTVAADVEACKASCDLLVGADYFTFFKNKESLNEDGKNCGCYRTCVLTAQDITVGRPNSYKVLSRR